MADAPVQAPAQAPVQALFYSDPQPIAPSLNGNWRLLTGNFSFTANALCIPLVLGEFAQASHHFPVLFAGGEDGGPIVLTGLDKANLFVTGEQWDVSAYIPAYVRRYPFGFVAMNPEGTNLALCIDAGCPWIAKDGTEGRPLFENGETSQLTKDAMEFCGRYSEEIARTKEFTDALRAKGLLLDRRLDGTLPNGEKFLINGFQIIDEKKLTELDSETVVEWHRKGWLACAYFHLASLERVNDLILRHMQRLQAVAA